MLLRKFCSAFFLAAILHSHAAHAVEDVPFVVTPDHVMLAMLRIADVGPRDYLIDLGSGDGRIVITAAKHFGARGLGVEIDPDLVLRSREYARAMGVLKQTEFREQDIFQTDLSQATVITMYLLPEVNLQLRPALLALKPGTRIVSHDWDMGEWRADRMLTVPDKALRREKASHVYLWIVPARVEGTWCGRGKFVQARIQLRQVFQDVEGIFLHNGAAQSFAGTLRGAILKGRKRETGKPEFHLDGDELVLKSGPGAFNAARGARFIRAVNDAC